MSDNGPDSIVLRYLRNIDSRLERLEQETRRYSGMFEVRLSAIETRIIAIEARMTAIEDWSHDVTRRLERIERRLDLVEPAQGR